MTGLVLLTVALAAAQPPAAEAKPAARPEAARTAEGEAAAKKADEAPKPRRVIDTSYQPSVGDRAVLMAMDEKTGETLFIWGAPTPDGYREHRKAEQMKDEKRQEQLQKDGKAVEFDDETEVIVTGLDTAVIPINTQMFITAEVASVRVTSGKLKGKEFYTDADNVVRLVRAPEAPAVRRAARKAPKSVAAKASGAPKAAAPRAAPASRAVTLLRMGQGLEKSARTAGALDYYRKVVGQFPGTPEARTAAARIEALSAK